MSNRTTPAESQSKQSETEWKTPNKGGYPEHSPRSNAMKWLKSEEAFLTVMRSSTQGDLLASISLMLKQKDELLSIIERFPTLTSSGPAAVREKASVVDYIDDEMEQKIAYRVDLGERSHEQAFKLVSYLIVGNTKLWRLIRLYFVYVVLSDEATVLMQDPDDATRFIKMDFGSVALEQTNAFADSISDYLTLIVTGKVQEAWAGILEVDALCEWLGITVGLWGYTTVQEKTFAKLHETIGFQGELTHDPSTDTYSTGEDANVVPTTHIIGEFDSLAFLEMREEAIERIQKEEKRVKALAVHLRKRWEQTVTPPLAKQKKVTIGETPHHDLPVESHQKPPETATIVSGKHVDVGADHGAGVLSSDDNIDDIDDIEELRRRLRQANLNKRMRDQKAQDHARAKTNERKKELHKVRRAEKKSVDRSSSDPMSSDSDSENEKMKNMLFSSLKSAIKGSDEHDTKTREIGDITPLNISAHFDPENIQKYSDWLDIAENDIAKKKGWKSRSLWGKFCFSSNEQSSVYTSLKHHQKDSFEFQNLDLRRKEIELGDEILIALLPAVPKFIRKKFTLFCKTGSFSSLMEDLRADDISDTQSVDSAATITTALSQSRFFCVDGLLTCCRIHIFKNTQPQRDQLAAYVYKFDVKEWWFFEENVMNWVSFLKVLRVLKVKMPAAPKLYQHFLKMLQPLEENFKDVEWKKGQLGVEKSLSSLGEDDYTLLFNAITELYTYGVACSATCEPSSGRVPHARAGAAGLGDHGNSEKGDKGSKDGKDRKGKPKGKGDSWESKWRQNAGDWGKSGSGGWGKSGYGGGKGSWSAPKGSWASVTNGGKGGFSSSEQQHQPTHQHTSWNGLEVQTKQIKDPDSGCVCNQPVWLPTHPECGWFLSGKCKNGPECKIGQHVISDQNYKSCLWCGNPQHYLKICPHRQKLHPDWSPDFLKKCIKFPSKKGVPTKDVQYYCASIIASQMSGTEPKLNLQQNSQPKSDLGARSIKVNSQSVSDFADFAALDPMRALQRNTTTTTSTIPTSTGETNDE